MDTASRRGLVLAGVIVLSSLALAACGSSNPPGGGNHAPKAGSSLSTANVSGAGSILVDGRSRTVYVLVDAQEHAVACTAASGCLGVWPPVVVTAPGTKPTTGSGAMGNLVGISGGVVTYHGWPLYEYTGDSGSGQANGVSIASFGGTWYALRGDGTLVKSVSNGGGGGYNY
jgi:predicted lipoprotein with Yx(FWY)xxD motif